MPSNGPRTEQHVLHGAMDGKTFQRFRQFIYDHSGIQLRDGKETMLAARVRKRMTHLGYETFSDYLEHVQHDSSGEELVQMLDSVSTNVTSFFRERHHFELLGQALKQWLAGGQKKYRIWSAASSTGPEPYSIAMVMQQMLGEQTGDMRILATDISTRVLGMARAGAYSAEEVAPVPKTWRFKYFSHDRESDRYTVDPQLRRMISFCRLNLSTPPFPMKGPFDAVFCRNVMIYFDMEVRRRLVEEIRRLLRPGGLFMLGHAESLAGQLTDGFVRFGPSCYRRL